MGNTAMVAALPNCDFCQQLNKETTAEYDAKTIYGHWANMCGDHFAEYGNGLGTGRGQKLILKGDPDSIKQYRSAERNDFLTNVVVTAVEGGIGYWSQVDQYKWFFPDLAGGTHEPSPGNGANASAIVHELNDAGDDYKEEGVLFDLDAVERGIKKAILCGHLEIATASSINDAGDLDANHADVICQFAILGDIVYG